jgi:Collagen triple helix repeat (20 copies)
LKGDAGRMGLSGFPGDPGEPGIPGFKGNNGIDGASGLPGERGDDGYPGETPIKNIIRPVIKILHFFWQVSTAHLEFEVSVVSRALREFTEISVPKAEMV